jgi:hypothetical protein
VGGRAGAAAGALTARVTDLTGTLDATQRGRLEAQLAAIDRSGRAQIAVLLLPTTQPETIEQFGIRLAEAWKIGRKGADNGSSSSSPRTIARCASRSATAWKGRSRRHRQPHRRTSAWRRPSSRAISSAACAPPSRRWTRPWAARVAPANRRRPQPAPRDTNTGGRTSRSGHSFWLFGWSGRACCDFRPVRLAGGGHRRLARLHVLRFNWLGAAIAAVVVFLFPWARCPRAVVAAAVFRRRFFLGRGRRLFGWRRQLRRRRRIGELVT